MGQIYQLFLCLLGGGSFYLSNFVFSTNESPGVYSITDVSTRNIVSPNISIGVWQISGGVVINRGGGTFSADSFQQLIITQSTGTGTLSTLAMIFPITGGNLRDQVVTPMVTATYVATSVSTLNFALLTSMATYSATTGYIRFMFTKIGDVGGGVVSLNANNTFTGTNTFNSKLDTRAGIVAPVASLTYTSDMIGYSFTNTPQTLTTFTSNNSSSYDSETLAIGVWLVFANQVIVRNGGSFGVDSFTTSIPAVSGASGTVYAGGNGHLAIPSGYTGLQFNTQYSYTVRITSAAKITTTDLTVMTVGPTGNQATRSIRMSFTRIA